MKKIKYFISMEFALTKILSFGGCCFINWQGFKGINYTSCPGRQIFNSHLAISVKNGLT